MKGPCSALAAVLLLSAPGAQAHHSGAMFDYESPKELSGTVRAFQFTNPHCYIQLTVRNGNGQEEEWSVEMGAPTHLRGRGWKRTTLKPGDRIRVVISPLRNGGRGGELRTLTTPDGKPLAGLS